MGSRERFIPMNMREGRPARLIQSAVTLSKWAKGNVRDVDSFLAFESAFSLLADDLDEVFCPHNTIVQIFYTSFRKNELAQFRWFIRGVQFPRNFSHPLAHLARHAAALGVFPQVLEDDTDLRQFLLFCQADEVGMKIGINFLEIPARRIMFNDMDGYVTNFSSQKFDNDNAYTNTSPPSPNVPYSPQLPIRNNLPRVEQDPSDTRPAHLPPALLALLNAINVHRATDQSEDATGHTNDPRAVPTRIPRIRSPLFIDNSSDTIYGDATTDPLHPDSYDW
jgi:hypothetical protein